jgi:hypothetical protein
MRVNNDCNIKICCAELRANQLPAVAEVAKISCAEGTLTYAVSRCPKLQAPIGNYLRRPTQRPPWTTKKPVAAEVFKTASGNFKFLNEFNLLTYNLSC